MGHIIVPEAEAVLDQEFPVLNKGFVRLVDYLGGDQRIVQSARVSYGEGTKSYRKDAALIDYLLRNEHTSPFEQVVLTFHTKMPVFVARQWVRHRTARLNEISGRYSVMKDEFYLPDGRAIAVQSEDNKQGRSLQAVPESEQKRILERFETVQREAYAEYSRLIDDGLARELARVNLPLSLYTEWYWQIDLHNLFHFLKLRMDAHAQLEIRAYAETMFELTKKVCPAACASFENHTLHSVRFSSTEFDAVRRLIDQGGSDDAAVPESAVTEAGKAAGLTGRALDRFVLKISGGGHT